MLAASTFSPTLLQTLWDFGGETFDFYKQAFCIIRDRARKVPGRMTVGSVLVILVSVILTFALQQSYGSSAELGGKCPGPLKVPTRAVMSSRHPIALLTAAKRENSLEQQSEYLRQCVEWQPPADSAASSEELLAQLACRRAIVGLLPSSSQALVEHAASLLDIVDLASRRCDLVQQRLYSIRLQEKGRKEPPKLYAALSQWASLGKQLRDAFDILTDTTRILAERADAGDSNATDTLRSVAPHRIKLQGCSLRGSREARLISHQMQQIPAVGKMERCLSTRLVNIECMALEESYIDAEAGMNFTRGLLISDIAMSPKHSPFFRGTMTCCQTCQGTRADGEGHMVPGGIALAEAMLSSGHESTIGPERVEKAVLRAIQLCQHANHLAQLSLPGPAIDWRYRAGADIAATYGREKLAANALAKFSVFLYGNARSEEALEVASQAVILSPDPTALFQQTRLRFELRMLKSGDEASTALRQLLAIEPGSLSKKHEMVRLALISQLRSFHEVLGAQGLLACLALGDAAHVLACAFGKALYL